YMVCACSVSQRTTESAARIFRRPRGPVVPELRTGFATENLEGSGAMNANVATQAKGLMDRVLEYVGRGCERIDREGERLEEYTEREPGRALWLALGVGVLVGLLVKRR